MAFAKPKKPKYVIGIIIDDSVSSGNLRKTRRLFDKVKSLISAQSFIVDLKVYIAIGKNVNPDLKRKIQKASADDTHIPNAYFIWFDGKNYTHDEMKRRLKKRIRQVIAPDKEWIIDLDGDFTGDTISRFSEVIYG